MSSVTAVVLLAGIEEFRGLILRHDCVNSSAHFEELCEEESEMLLNHLNNTDPLRTVVFTYTNWCEVLREVYLPMGENKRENRQTPGQQSLSTTGTACHWLLLQSAFPASPIHRHTCLQNSRQSYGFAIYKACYRSDRLIRHSY